LKAKDVVYEQADTGEEAEFECGSDEEESAFSK
jgi:hypothetical protein